MRRIYLDEQGSVVRAETVFSSVGDGGDGIIIPDDTPYTDTELVEGYSYVDGAIVTDPLLEEKTISNRKIMALSKVEKDYSDLCRGTDPVSKNRIYVDCVVGEDTYRMNAGRNAALNMDSGVRIFERSGATTMPEIRDFYDNNHLNVPMAVAISISVQQGADALSYWRRKGEIVDAINSATTLEEIDSIDTTFTVRT